MSNQSEASHHVSVGRKLFSRDTNYLRDLALFWPFVFYTIFAVGSAFTPTDRRLALRFGTVVIAAVLLARERLVLFLAGLGFIAIQCAINLILHRWNWGVFAAGILAGTPSLLASRYWRPKLAYELPKEMRLVDALWSVASIIGSLPLMYVVDPFS